MKKRKIKYQNIAILLAIVGIVILLVVGVMNIINSKPDPKPNQDKPVERMKMDVLDYSFYNTKDFDFNFVIVKLRISDNEPIYYGLDSIYTDEGLRLSEYEKYQMELEKKYYYLGAQNISDSLISEKEVDNFNIFVPIKDKSKREIVIYEANSKVEFRIDLNKNQKDLEELKYHTGGEVEFNQNLLAINDAYIANGFYKDGEVYTYPAVINILAFVLNVEEISEDGIYIEEAFLEIEGSKEKIKALDKSYTNMKVNNIMKRELFKGDKAALFFELSAEDSNVKGTLKIKFNNSDEYLSLETEIK